MITGAVNVLPEGNTALLTGQNSPVKPKDDAFLNLLAQKIDDRTGQTPPEKTETPVRQEEASKTAGTEVVKSVSEEKKSAERAKERLISDCAGLIERLKELPALLKTKGSLKKEEAVREKLILEIGAFFDRIRNLDLFKSSSRDLREIKADLKEQLKVKDLKERDIFQKVMIFLRNLKQGLEEAGRQTGIFKPLLTENRTSSPENSLAQESRLFVKNRKVEVQNIKSDTRDNGSALSSDQKNETPGLKHLLHQKIEVAAAAGNSVQRLFENRREEEIQTRRIDSRELMNRITEKIKISLNENKSEVVMNLKPEFLGKLTVKLEFKENTIAGKFIVDNIYAEKAVKDGLAQLKVAFQGMGMEVSHFDVSLSGGENPSARQTDFFASARTDGFGTDRIAERASGEALTQVYDQTGWIARNVNITI